MANGRPALKETGEATATPELLEHDRVDLRRGPAGDEYVIPHRGDPAAQRATEPPLCSAPTPTTIADGLFFIGIPFRADTRRLNASV